MAKSEKKKSAKEASNVFHNIMAASVKPDINKRLQAIKHIQEEVAMVVPDYGEYLVMQISANQLFYNISNHCPIEKHQKIEKIILENAELLDLPVTTDDIE